MVGEIDHRGFGVHPEGDGHQLGVHGVDQVDQAGAAHRSRCKAAVVEDVGQVGRRCGLLSGLGDLGDDDMRIARVLGSAMGQASCQGRPTGRVQRPAIMTSITPPSAGAPR